MRRAPFPCPQMQVIFSDKRSTAMKDANDGQMGLFAPEVMSFSGILAR